MVFEVAKSCHFGSGKREKLSGAEGEEVLTLKHLNEL